MCGRRQDFLILPSFFPLKPTEKIANTTRTYRRMHKWVAIPMLSFMFVIGLTGVMLGWKKQAKLTPPTETGTSADPRQWLALDSIHHIAQQYAKDSLQGAQIDRIDVRPAKGTAKILFTNDYTELQIDLTSGRIARRQKRWNDLIEHIHDGTIVDRLLGTGGDPFKIGYTSMTSLGLILLSVSGFWMWWNPKRIRRLKRHTD